MASSTATGTGGVIILQDTSPPQAQGLHVVIANYPVRTCRLKGRAPLIRDQMRKATTPSASSAGNEGHRACELKKDEKSL